MASKPILPPGNYTVVIDRVRKVRNKPVKRITMHLVAPDDPKIDGHVLTGFLREEPNA